MKEQNNIKYIENDRRILYAFNGEKQIMNFEEKSIFT